MNATLFVVCATFAAFRDALVNPNITHIAWNGTMLVSESVAVRGTKTLECVTGGYGCALDFSNGHSLELPHASSRVTATSSHFENVWHAADASTPPYIVVSNGGEFYAAYSTFHLRTAIPKGNTLASVTGEASRASFYFCTFTYETEEDRHAVVSTMGASVQYYSCEYTPRVHRVTLGRGDVRTIHVTAPMALEWIFRANSPNDDVVFKLVYAHGDWWSNDAMRVFDPLNPKEKQTAVYTGDTCMMAPGDFCGVYTSWSDQLRVSYTLATEMAAAFTFDTRFVFLVYTTSRGARIAV